MPSRPGIKRHFHGQRLGRWYDIGTVRLSDATAILHPREVGKILFYFSDYDSAFCRRGGYAANLSRTRAVPGQDTNSADAYFPLISSATSCLRTLYLFI